MNFKAIKRLPEFDKDLKKLRKKFRTLEDDLETFIKTQLRLYHKLDKDNQGIFIIPKLNIQNHTFYKAKKFACRSLPKTGCKSGMRIIYTYDEREDKIELIEIYFKSNKENEDRERIKRNYL